MSACLKMLRHRRYAPNDLNKQRKFAGKGLREKTGLFSDNRQLWARLSELYLPKLRSYAVKEKERIYIYPKIRKGKK